MTTILLADDHQLVRQGLKALLENVSGMQVVGEAGDGLRAFEEAERLRPDVVVLDLMMPGMSGLEVTRKIAEQLPECRIVVLSMHADESYVLEALRNGASGYVLKAATGSELAQAIREVVAGRRYLSPPLSDRAIEVYLDKARSGSLDVYDTLSEREREVLQLAAQGLSNAEIAARLFISPRTVETHRAHLMRKLGLRSHVDLVRYAILKGIIPLEKQ